MFEFYQLSLVTYLTFKVGPHVFGHELLLIIRLFNAFEDNRYTDQQPIIYAVIIC